MKKAELQLGIVNQSLEQVKRQCGLLEQRAGDHAHLLAVGRGKREELAGEVEQLRKGVAQQVRALVAGESLRLD